MSTLLVVAEHFSASYSGKRGQVCSDIVLGNTVNDNDNETMILKHEDTNENRRMVK